MKAQTFIDSTNFRLGRWKISLGAAVIVSGVRWEGSNTILFIGRLIAWAVYTDDRPTERKARWLPTIRLFGVIKRPLLTSNKRKRRPLLLFPPRKVVCEDDENAD